MKKVVIILGCIILPAMMLGDVAHAWGRVIIKPAKRVVKIIPEIPKFFTNNKNDEDERKRLKRRKDFPNGIGVLNHRDLLKQRGQRELSFRKKKKPDEIQRMRDARDSIKLDILQKRINMLKNR